MNAMLFEGPVLEDVLHEARLCFGPDVEIEAANRVRKGGMLGFFATEWYEVWARPSAAVADNPALALLDHEDDPDSFQAMVRTAMADRSLQSGEGDPLGAYETAMDTFFDDRAPAAPTRSPVPVSTAAPAHSAPAGIPPVPAAMAPTPAPVGPAGGVATMAPAPAAVAVRPAPGPAPMTAAGPAPVATLPRPAETGATVLTAAGPVPIAAGLGAGATSAAVALEDAPRGESVFDEVRTPRTDVLWAMLDRLESVPRSPDLPAAGVVAFVGEATAALEAARNAGTRTGLWNADVVVLTRRAEIEGVPSWLLIDDLDELAARVQRWRQRGTLGPVVIDQGLDVGDRAWAARALTDLGIDQVRLVTEAWRLPEDIGRMASKLGGVDALELVEVSGSVEPLAMLDLGIPVASVEGRTATPELLAAVYLENRRRV